MEYKKFSPMIGKELTWPLLDTLVEEIRKEFNMHLIKKKPRTKAISKRRRTEDDGA